MAGLARRPDAAKSCARCWSCWRPRIETAGGTAGHAGTRRYPTPAIAQTARLVRSLYFRFADMEKDLDEPNLRAPSHDYIDFAYRWSAW